MILPVSVALPFDVLSIIHIFPPHSRMTPMIRGCGMALRTFIEAL